MLFFLPTTADITLEIFAINGQLLSSVAVGRHASGYHLYEWNATDDRGSSLPSGVYLCRLRAGEHHDFRKLIFIR
ncbi:MAG: hypothetical protein EHM72_18030 [Calditrichaeota bacterium]|nr:MAG: hypothetical protein EHM72_18030 [Calditrichota bacterium]